MFALDLQVLAQILGTSAVQVVAKLGTTKTVNVEAKDEIKLERRGIAVVTAARRRSNAPPKELLGLGGSPVICHALKSLESAGIDIVLVVVGHKGQEIQAAISERRWQMKIHFVDLGDDWSGTHAMSIQRSLPRLLEISDDLSKQPVLLVTSDHLFDRSLIEAMMDESEAALLVEGGLHERQLAEDLLPATAVRVRTRLDDDGKFWCERVGRRVDDHDAFDAGLLRVKDRSLFDALDKLASRKKYFALCDALDILARRSQLRAIFARDRPWLAVETEQQVHHVKVRLNSPSFDPTTLPFEVVKPSADHDLVTIDEEEEEEEVTTSREYEAVAANDAALVTKLQNLSAPRGFVEDNDALVVAVVENDAAYALIPKDVAEECREWTATHPYDEFLGRNDPSDIATISLNVQNATTLQVDVERRVPAIGWFILIIATAAQASGALAFAKLDKEKPDQLTVLCWRSLAAVLGALPLLALHHPQYRERPLENLTPQRRNWAALLLGVGCLWLSNATYSLALALSTSPSNVVLATSLTPLFIILARLLGLYGIPPSFSEIMGTFIGLVGCFICAWQPPNDEEQVGVLMLCLLCVVAQGGYSITAKEARCDYGAVDLHIMLQFGSFIISCVVLFLYRGPGTFRSVASGFLQHWPLFLWTGVGVDTLGTFGYVAALRYVDPLLTTVASLFQPLCAALDSSIFFRQPLPALSYYVGVGLLISGASLIVQTQSHQIIDAHDALRHHPSDVSGGILSTTPQKPRRRSSWGRLLGFPRRPFRFYLPLLGSSQTDDLRRDDPVSSYGGTESSS